MATLGDGKDGGKSVQISEANNASNLRVIFVIGFCSSAPVLTQTYIVHNYFVGKEKGTDIRLGYSYKNFILFIYLGYQID